MMKPDRDRVRHHLDQIHAILIQEIETLHNKPNMKRSLEYRERDVEKVRALREGKNHEFGFLYHDAHRARKQMRRG